MDGLIIFVIHFFIFAVSSWLIATCIKRRRPTVNSQSCGVAVTPVAGTPNRATSPITPPCAQSSFKSPSTEPLKFKSPSREQPTSTEVIKLMSKEFDPRYADFVPQRPARKLASAEVLPLVDGTHSAEPKKKDDSEEVLENATPPQDFEKVQRPPGHLDMSSKSGKQNYHALEPTNLEVLRADYWATLLLPVFLPLLEFWKSFDVVAQTPDLPKVVPSASIVFSIRDLVATKEPVLASLASRVLEPLPVAAAIGRTETKTEDGTTSTLSAVTPSGTINVSASADLINIRIFVTNYDPMTIEICFSGKTVPDFIWKIVGTCETCNIYKKMFETAGNFIGVDKAYPAWKDVVCQVGQMPGNHHTFFSAMKPNSTETEIYHVMVIKGDKSTPGNMPPCSRGCKPDSAKWHSHDIRVLPLYRANNYQPK